jgi:hypothetical protein
VAATSFPSFCSGIWRDGGHDDTLSRQPRLMPARHKKAHRAHVVPQVRHVVPARHEHDGRCAASCSCPSCPCHVGLMSCRDVLDGSNGHLHITELDLKYEIPLTTTGKAIIKHRTHNGPIN